MRSEAFVAVGLFTRRDLDVVGSGFRWAYPLEHSGDFDDLLRRLDQVDSDPPPSLH